MIINTKSFLEIIGVLEEDSEKDIRNWEVEVEERERITRLYTIRVSAATEEEAAREALEYYADGISDVIHEEFIDNEVVSVTLT